MRAAFLPESIDATPEVIQNRSRPAIQKREGFIEETPVTGLLEQSLHRPGGPDGGIHEPAAVMLPILKL